MSVSPATSVSSWRERLPAVAGLVVLALSLVGLSHLAEGFSVRDVLHHLRALPGSRVLLALALTALSYSIHTVFDTLGCRFVGHPLPYRKIAFASFVGYAFGNTVGIPLISGNSIRYRLYSSWGLSGVQVTAIVAFCILAYTLGSWLAVSLTLAFYPRPLLPLSPWLSHGLGVLMLVVLVGYLALNVRGQGKYTVWGKTLTLPGWRVSALQMTLSALTIVLDAAVLYLLLPPALGLTFGQVLAGFVLSSILGHLSQVPGGFGVLEASMLLLLPTPAGRSLLLGGLVLFRVVYHLLPLLLAMLLLATYELLHERGWLRTVLRAFPVNVGDVWPQILSLTSSAAGALLILGGSLPVPPWSMAFLRSVPLALVEGGHVVGSLCGLLLLLLSTRFERAERWALRPAVWALTIGIGCTLLRGFGIPQAIILTVLLLTLLAGRSALQSAARTRRPLPSDPAWLLTVGMTLCAAIFLTTLSFWSTFEDQAQWLRVDYLATGARALRTLTVVTAVAALVALPVGAGWQAKLPRRRRRRG